MTNKMLQLIQMVTFFESMKSDWHLNCSYIPVETEEEPITKGQAEMNAVMAALHLALY